MSGCVCVLQFGFSWLFWGGCCVRVFCSYLGDWRLVAMRGGRGGGVIALI